MKPLRVLVFFLLISPSLKSQSNYFAYLLSDNPKNVKIETQILDTCRFWNREASNEDCINQSVGLTEYQESLLKMFGSPISFKGDIALIQPIMNSEFQKINDLHFFEMRRIRRPDDGMYILEQSEILSKWDNKIIIKARCDYFLKESYDPNVIYNFGNTQNRFEGNVEMSMNNDGLIKAISHGQDSITTHFLYQNGLLMHEVIVDKFTPDNYLDSILNKSNYHNHGRRAKRIDCSWSNKKRNFKV